MCRYEERGGGRRKPSRRLRRQRGQWVLESNEVKGVEVSGSRVRRRLIGGRSNLRHVDGESCCSAARRVGARSCVCVQTKFERQGLRAENRFSEQQTGRCDGVSE